MSTSESRPPGLASGREFPLTHWSVVLAAANGAGSEGTAAWEDLCQRYWYPIYAFLRRSGHGPHDAQDLTQGFLASLIEKRDLEGIERGGGRFRSFLLGTLKHFVSDERKKARAQKRGGGLAHVSLDEELGESRYRLEPADTGTPESLFEREWGLTVLARAMEQLRADQLAHGKAEQFAALEPCLGGSRQPTSYAEIGARLGMSEANVKVVVHRLRKEFGRVLRAQIAPTVATESEIDDELRHLIRVTGA